MATGGFLKKIVLKKLHLDILFMVEKVINRRTELNVRESRGFKIIQ